MGSVLIVDDQRGMCESLEMLFRIEGFLVSSTTDPYEGVRIATESKPSVLVSDMRMDGLTGLELMQRVKSQSPSTEFIIMTAYATVDDAVQAMRLGAFDYIMKPFKNEAILGKVMRAIEYSEQRRGRVVGDTCSGGIPTLIAESAAMRQGLELVGRLAPTQMSLFISGETGTGKSLLARYIHASSARADGPFVHVNCAALPESLVESEFFGHTKGAFTGATSRHQGLFQDANKGTLFLDEVGLLPISQQPKLLLALEQGEVRPVGSTRAVSVDVRVVAASNEPLTERVKAGLFRQDLYYRLAAATVCLPPLRERREDIPALAQLCLDRICTKLGRELEIDAAAMELLTGYSFPGNVRELDNIMHWAAAVAQGAMIGCADLPEVVRRHTGQAFAQEGTAAAPAAEPFADLRGMTRHVIIDCLQRHGGDLASVSRALGISRTTLWRRMKEYGLDSRNR